MVGVGSGAVGAGKAPPMPGEAAPPPTPPSAGRGARRRRLALPAVKPALPQRQGVRPRAGRAGAPARPRLLRSPPAHCRGSTISICRRSRATSVFPRPCAGRRPASRRAEAGGSRAGALRLRVQLRSSIFPRSAARAAVASAPIDLPSPSGGGGGGFGELDLPWPKAARRVDLPIAEGTAAASRDLPMRRSTTICRSARCDSLPVGGHNDLPSLGGDDLPTVGGTTASRWSAARI